MAKTGLFDSVRDIRDHSMRKSFEGIYASVLGHRDGVLLGLGVRRCSTAPFLHAWLHRTHSSRSNYTWLSGRWQPTRRTHVHKHTYACLARSTAHIARTSVATPSATRAANLATTVGQDKMSDQLLESSRSLANLIQGASDLPPVSRSIHQIAEQSERMLNAGGANASAPAGAATYRFLASQGVDAMDLDPNVIELERDAAAAAAPGGATRQDAAPHGSWEELEAFNENQLQVTLHEVIAEANEVVIYDFEQKMRRVEREMWAQQRAVILRKLQFEKGRYDSGAPVLPGGGGAPSAAGGMGGGLAPAPPGAPAPPHSLGHSAVRSSRSLEFAGALARLWEARASGGPTAGVGPGVGAPFNLVGSWLEVASSARVASLEGASTKLTNLWQLVQRMTTAAAPLLGVAAGQSAAGQAQLRVSLLDGAVAHLGQQQHQVLTRVLDEQREAGMRGGVPGTEYDAAAKLTIEGGTGAPAADGTHHSAMVTLEGGRTTPLWPTVYWCLRCGDVGAAVRVMRHAATQQVANPTSWTALLALAAGHESSIANGASNIASGRPDGGGGAQLAELIAAARNEYWAGGAPSEWHLAVAYSVLACPDVGAKLEELMPESARNQLTIEEWLWHRLCLVRVQLLEAGGGSGDGVGPSPLSTLQTLLYNELGEGHFNGDKQVRPPPHSLSRPHRPWPQEHVRWRGEPRRPFHIVRACARVLPCCAVLTVC